MAPTTIAAAKIECAVASGDVLGETPLWCERAQKLWWVDIERRLHRAFDPASGACATFQHACGFLGSQALTRDGAHLVARDLSLSRHDAASGVSTLLADVERGPDNRLNDGRVDARGRLWIGTMDNALHRPKGALYRVDPDGAVTRQFGDVIVTNGIAFAPDNRTLYFTDTRRHRSFRFDLDLDDGTIRNRQIFADYTTTGDRPDGACVDVDGGIWTAFFSGERVVRYRPDGTIDLVIPMPVTNPTCVCFGGHDLRTLFVTSARKFLDDAQLARESAAGHVFAIHGIAQGLPEHRFG